MNWKTERRLRFAGSMGLLAVPAVSLAKMAASSGKPFRRAGKAAAVAGSVGGLVAGGLGLADQTDSRDDEQIQYTLGFGAYGAVLAATLGGLASLTRSALRSR